MSEEESDIIISCSDCGATADYDTPCPNGCDSFTSYLCEDIELNISSEDINLLSSYSLTGIIEILKDLPEGE
jgi:hypothetical protein